MKFLPPQFVSISVDYEHHNLIKITIDIAPRTSKHTKHMNTQRITCWFTSWRSQFPSWLKFTWHQSTRHMARFTWHQGRSHSTRHTSARQRAPRLRSARLIWPIAIGGWMTAATTESRKPQTHFGSWAPKGALRVIITGGISFSLFTPKTNVTPMVSHNIGVAGR